MIPPLISRTASEVGASKVSTFVRTIEPEIADPLVKFLNKDFRINKPCFSFADIYAQSPESSYAISHGIIGQKLDIVSK